MNIPMGRPEKRLQPSPPEPVNAIERYMGHLIKMDSEGGIYWTRPDTQCSVTWVTVEGCRLDISAWCREHPVHDDEDGDSETEAA